MHTEKTTNNGTKQKQTSVLDSDNFLILKNFSYFMFCMIKKHVLYRYENSWIKFIYYCRLHDVFHGQIDKGEMCLSVVYEKCDWDLYEFLRTIPRDMGDHQCRHIAKQVSYVSIRYTKSKNFHLLREFK